MERTKFRELAIGDTFEFAFVIDNPDSGMCRGPWKKISPRRYESLDNHLMSNSKREAILAPLVCRVGTTAAEVYRL